MQNENMADLAPSFGARLLYVALAWVVALLAVSPMGVAVLAFPLGLGFILLGVPWGLAAGWSYYFFVTLAVFLPERPRAFRYAFYVLAISLIVNVGGCYKLVGAIGRD